MTPAPCAAAAVRRVHAGVLIAILVLGPGFAATCQQRAPSAVASATPIPSSSIPSSSPPPATGAAAVAVDPSLLEILPGDVAGTPIVADPETASTIAADPSVATDVEAIAVALAVSTGSSGGEDLVIANVVRLRQDVFDAAFFEVWRDSYDESACEPAGGVRDRGEDQIGERHVFTGTCVNGGLTYHVRYGEDVIVSLTATGEGRYGELVIAHLGE